MQFLWSIRLGFGENILFELLFRVNNIHTCLRNRVLTLFFSSFKLEFSFLITLKLIILSIKYYKNVSSSQLVSRSEMLIQQPGLSLRASP